MTTSTRADADVTAILQIIRLALERDHELRAALAELLCDEFDDIKRQTISEIRREDE